MLSDLAFHLAGRGMSVCVVTSRLRYDDPSAALADFGKMHGVDIRRVWTTRFGRGNLLGRAFDYLTFYLSAAWVALRLVRRGDVLIAKTDPPLISVVAGMVAGWRGAPLINWVQDMFPEVAQALGVPFVHGRIGAMITAVRDRSLRAARCNVVLGERMAGLVMRRGVPRERIATIPNWADDSIIQPIAPSANPLRAEWGLTDKFVVGYSGNLGRVHEFGTILDAAVLSRDDPRIVFLFIGSGAQAEAVKNEVVRRALRNFVFRPYQPRTQLANSLGAADLHLVSLRPEVEGLIVPSKFYGIAAAGRPVAFIGDQDGEIARIVRRHDCGRSFAVGDAAGLSVYIRALAQDPDEAARLGTNARTALDAHYSQARAFELWEKVLSAGPNAGSPQ